MKLLLASGNLLPQHIARFEQLLGKLRAAHALFITAAAVPYGLDPKPDWLQRSVRDIEAIATQYTETSLQSGELVPTSLDEYDLVFVSGGNVYYLAHMLHETGLDILIKQYIENNNVYMGSSAGSVILMSNLEAFSSADDPSVVSGEQAGIGLIEYGIVPHADNAKYADIIEKEYDDLTKHYSEVIKLNDDQIIIHDQGFREII